MNIISFSLFGNDPKYLVGAIKNIQQLKLFYPDWEILFFYQAGDLSDYIIKAFTLDQYRLLITPGPTDISGRFWRFLAVDWIAAEHVIVRDADSRFSLREVDAVNAWIASGKPFHCMRDHPCHGWPIMAGMWGIKTGFLPNMHDLIVQWLKAKGYGTEEVYGRVQEFLQEAVWPLVKDHACQHDAFFRDKYQSDPFPTARIGHRFVGEVYEADNQPRAKDWEQIPPDSI